MFAAGGLASVVAAVTVGRRGLPRRDITFMYAAWTLATLAVVGYGLASSVWQLMLAAAAFNSLETVGTIVWATAKQRHVPGHMLGRVSSLDWLISIGLLPLSFALTGPGQRRDRGARDARRRRHPRRDRDRGRPARPGRARGRGPDGHGARAGARGRSRSRAAVPAVPAAA